MPAADRRGAAIIMVIAFYAIAVSMIGVWVRAALDRQKQVRQWQEKTQTVWLAEAGVRRAVARVSSDNAYEGEVWQVDAEVLGGADSAAITIRVESVNATKGNEATSAVSSLKITAVATYPAGARKRVQHTKTIHYRSPAENNQSGESS